MEKYIDKNALNFDDVQSVDQAVSKLNYIVGLFVLMLGPINLIFGSLLSITNILTTAYYILFGMMILSANMKIEFVEKHFKFLSNPFGRGVFTIYIGTLYFNYSNLGVLYYLFYLVFAIMAFIGAFYLYEGFKGRQQKQTELDTNVSTIRGI